MPGRISSKHCSFLTSIIRSINYISLRFIRPLEVSLSIYLVCLNIPVVQDLTKLLNYIENPDLEFNDSLDNSKPREKGDIKQHSYEINTLYRTFHLIKTVVNHAKSAQKEQNSALALMHYAKILSIYNKLGNKRGAGIVHNNLGNIHLKSDRLDEALIEYRNAVRCTVSFWINIPYNIQLVRKN